MLYFKELLFFCFWIFFFNLFIFRERGKERERERNINVWLLLVSPPLGTWSPTQACALTGNRTCGSLVHRPKLNPLSHTSQGWFFYKYPPTIYWNPWRIWFTQVNDSVWIEMRIHSDAPHKQRWNSISFGLYNLCSFSKQCMFYKLSYQMSIRHNSALM